MNDSSREAFLQWAEPRLEAVKGRSPQEQWIWSQAWEEAWFAREAAFNHHDLIGRFPKQARELGVLK